MSLSKNYQNKCTSNGDVFIETLDRTERVKRHEEEKYLTEHSVGNKILRLN